MITWLVVIGASHAFTSRLSILDFGGKADGTSNNHKAINRAMAACSAAGGCELSFPRTSGTTTLYLTSSFAVCSNLTLVIPGGVMLRATETDIHNIGAASWPTLPWLEYPSMPCNDCPYACGAGCGPVKRGWLYGQNVTNVRITGGGILHGGGNYWWCARDPAQNGARKYQPPKNCPARNSTNMLKDECPPRMVHLVGAAAVTISNVTLTTSGFWLMHLQFCDRVLLEKVTMFNPNNGTFEGKAARMLCPPSSSHAHLAPSPPHLLVSARPKWRRRGYWQQLQCGNTRLIDRCFR
jgi:polygalacturonase